jgi:hypothetical protein
MILAGVLTNRYPAPRVNGEPKQEHFSVILNRLREAPPPALSRRMQALHHCLTRETNRRYFARSAEGLPAMNDV